MHKLIRTLGFAMLGLSLASCRIAYVPDVQQGNLFDKTIDKNIVNQLQPGLTKRQVLVLMGTPSISTPFDQNRWDYLSTYAHRGAPPRINKLTLYFNNETLVRTEGNLFSQDAQELVRDSKKYHASYPVDETEGDKTKTAEEKAKDAEKASGGDSSDH